MANVNLSVKTLLLPTVTTILRACVKLNLAEDPPFLNLVTRPCMPEQCQACSQDPGGCAPIVLTDQNRLGRVTKTPPVVAANRNLLEGGWFRVTTFWW